MEFGWDGPWELLCGAGIGLGLMFAVALYALTNWLRRRAALPLAVVGWFSTGLTIYAQEVCFAAYLSMRNNRGASMASAYLGLAVLLIGVLAFVATIAHSQRKRGHISGKYGFPHLMAEGFLAFMAIYALANSRYAFADVLRGRRNEVSDILQSFAWMDGLLMCLYLTLVVVLLLLELFRPDLNAALRPRAANR